MVPLPRPDLAADEVSGDFEVFAICLDLPRCWQTVAQLGNDFRVLLHDRNFRSSVVENLDVLRKGEMVFARFFLSRRWRGNDRDGKQQPWEKTAHAHLDRRWDWVV